MILNGGADQIFGDAGDDTLSGGAGDDVFNFRLGSGRDTISDYKDGEDLIRIQTGARSFDDLEITDADDDVLITFANVEILILDERKGRLDEDDFIF